VRDQGFDRLRTHIYESICINSGDLSITLLLSLNLYS